MSSSDDAIQYGVVPAGTTKTISGLQLLNAIMEGTLPSPPIQRGLEFRLVEVRPGNTAFAGTPKFEYYNPLGSVHSGNSTAVPDYCVHCVGHYTLLVGYRY